MNHKPEHSESEENEDNDKSDLLLHSIKSAVHKISILQEETDAYLKRVKQIDETKMGMQREMENIATESENIARLENQLTLAEQKIEILYTDLQKNAEGILKSRHADTSDMMRNLQEHNSMRNAIIHLKNKIYSTKEKQERCHQLQENIAQQLADLSVKQGLSHSMLHTDLIAFNSPELQKLFQDLKREDLATLTNNLTRIHKQELMQKFDKIQFGLRAEEFSSGGGELTHEPSFEEQEIVKGQDQIRFSHKKKFPIRFPQEKDIQINGADIRYLIRRDIPEIMCIEEKKTEDELQTEEEILSKLRQRNCIGTVVEYQNEIVAFMIYELHKSIISLTDFAVRSDFKRQGIGTLLMHKVIRKGLNEENTRNSITIIVKETNVEMLSFLPHFDFHSISVLREYFSDGRDGYVMCHDFNAEQVTDPSDSHHSEGNC